MCRRQWILGLIWMLMIFASCTVTKAYKARSGEILQYRLVVKSTIHGADQTIKVKAAENYKNRPALTVQSTLTSVGLVNKITGYSEIEELVMDAEEFYPYVIKREVHNGKKVEKEEVVFDYQKKLAWRTLQKSNEPIERSEIKLPGYVQDGLSLQFYLRKNELKPGYGRIFFYSDGGIDEFSYIMREVKQSIKLDSVVYPRYLEVKNDKVGTAVILSDDDARYPLIIRKINNFGKFEAKLVRAN